MERENALFFVFFVASLLYLKRRKGESVGACLLLYNKGLKRGVFTNNFLNKRQKSVKHFTSRALLSQNNACFSTSVSNKDFSPPSSVRAGLFYISKFLHIKYLCI